MFKIVYIFLANGFEEVEAITPFDYLKRSGSKVKTVGVNGTRICGAHDLKISTDVEIGDLKNTVFGKEDFIILPGGLEGTKNLLSNKDVLMFVIMAFNNASIGAICAAPVILGKTGVLQGKKACCYPGFEEALQGAKILNDDVVVDSNIITSRGAGTAQQFSFEIIKYLHGEEKFKEVKNSVQWRA